MRILFCNNSFPGQFEELATLLASRAEHDVLFASSYQRRDFSIPGVRRIVLKEAHGRAQATKDELVRLWTRTVTIGRSAYGVFTQLERSGFAPDLALFAAGCGESLFLREAFPAMFRVAYLWPDKAELEYGQDRDKCQFSALTQGMSLFYGHAAYAFTDITGIPPLLRPAVGSIAPFVDTQFFAPENAGKFAIDGRVFSANMELVSLDLRGNIDSGQDSILAVTFAMLLRQRPNCHILLTCHDPENKHLKALARLARLFPGRVSARSMMARAEYRDMLCASRVRIVPYANWRMRDLLEPLCCATPLLAHLPARQDFAAPTTDRQDLAALTSGRQNFAALTPGRTMLAWPDSSSAQLGLLNTVLDNREAMRKISHIGQQITHAEHSQQTILSRHIDDLLSAYERWKSAEQRA